MSGQTPSLVQTYMSGLTPMTPYSLKRGTSNGSYWALASRACSHNPNWESSLSIVFFCHNLKFMELQCPGFMCHKTISFNSYSCDLTVPPAN